MIQWQAHGRSGGLQAGTSGDTLERRLELAQQPVIAYRHWFSPLASILVVALTAWLVYQAAINPAFSWDVVAGYLFNRRIIAGLFLTIWLTVAVSVLGVLLGVALAAMRMSRNTMLRSFSATYVWFFRSIPLLVQLLFWYNINFIVSEIRIGIPFGPTLFTVDTREIFTAVFAALFGMVLHEAAYAAEIVRGGIRAVDRGTIEAGNALGLKQGTIFRHIILPQAITPMIPPLGNLLNGTLKATSIVSVIAVSDLLYSAQMIYTQNYLVVPLLVVVTLWYMACTAVLSVLQTLVEARFVGRNERKARIPGKAVLDGEPA